MLLPKTPLPHENKDNIMQIHSILLQSETAGLARDIRVYMPMKVWSEKPLANGGCRVKLKMQVKSTRQGDYFVVSQKEYFKYERTEIFQEVYEVSHFYKIFLSLMMLQKTKRQSDLGVE